MSRSRQTLRDGYRRIPYFTRYAVNRQGRIYRIEDGLTLTPYSNHGHWSGNLKLIDDFGNRHTVNVASMVSQAFGISREETLRRNIPCCV